MIYLFIITISFFLYTDLYSNYSIIIIDNNLTQKSEIFNSITGSSSKLLLSSIRDFSIFNYWFRFYFSNDVGANWH